MNKVAVRCAFVFALTTSLAQAQDISVTKTGQAFRSQGGDAIYTVTIQNVGAMPANSVSLTDAIPPGMTFVSNSQLSGPPFGCSNPTVGTNGTITCTIATLNAGASASFRFRFNIPFGTAEGTVFANTATGASSPADGNPTNDSSTANTTVVAPSDLGATKSGPETAPADTDVSYTVTINNFGPGRATDVTLTDPIPPGMTFVSATQLAGGPAFSCSTPAVGANGTITCSTTTLLPNQSATFTFVFHITPETPAGTSFTNIASADSPDLDPNDENDQGVAVTSTPPPPTADMGISKTGPTKAGPNMNVDFSISVSNSGPNAAANAAWQDTLPGTLEFISLTQTSGPTMTCTTPAVGAGGTVNCSAATFPVAATATFTLTVRVPAGTTSGTVYDNTATVSSTASDPNPENNSATASVVVSAVDLSIAKSGPPSANAGTNTTYTITVANAGPDAAQFVRWSDPIPAGTTFVSVTQTAGPSWSCTQAGGSVICNIALFGATATSTFSLVLNSGTATTISNTATVTSDSFDTNDSNNSSTADTTVTQSADLAVTKTAPASVTAGMSATYTVSVANNGPSAAQNVTLTDNAPANTSFVSVTQTSGPAFNCTGSTCTIGSFATGASATFQYVFAVSAGATGTIDNTATASSTTADPNGTNNSANTSTPVATSANLSLTKSGPASVTAGTTVTYTVTATNAGPSNAANVTLTDNAPANTTFVSVTQTSGPTFSCTGSTCTLASFAAGASATFQYAFAVQPGATGSVDNTATIASATPDPVAGNNSASATTPITASADLAVTKAGPASTTAGTSVTYTVTATNNGPSVASNVTLTDSAPANTTFVSVTQTGGPAFSCTGPTCTLASFAAGATATFQYVFAVNAGATGSISNTASITATTSDPAAANNSANATTPVVTSADLAVTKSGPASATAGSNATYTVTATNNGPSAAANVTLTDNAPANTTFVSVTQTSGPTFTCTGSTCTLASFAAGATATFQYVFAVNAGATGAISNTASISSNTADPAAANNSANTSTPVTTSADLAVTKAGPAAVTAGTSVTYTVTATNNGPSNAANVTLTDNAPAGTTFVSVTQTGGPAFTCTASTCTIASFAAGATATFQYVFAVGPGTSGSITNTATISAATADPTPANNSASANTPIGATADLSIGKTGPAAVNAGTNITYTLTASNAGPSSASSVTITDALPANTTFVSMTQTSGPAFNCTTPAPGATGTVTCTIATFAASASAVFDLIVNVPPAATGAVSNSATISSATVDPTPANASATAATTLNPAPTDLSITKTVSPSSAPQGGTVTYTVVVTNNGPGTASGTTMTDVLPPGMTLLSANTTQGTCTGTTTVICSLGMLAPAASATITMIVRVPQTAGPVSNTATVTAANPETAPANNSSTVALDVTAAIPTVSEWGLLLMAAFLAGAAVIAMRK